MGVETCSQCHTPRRGAEPVCWRCGNSFVSSAAPSASSPMLILRSTGASSTARPWEVSDSPADIGRNDGAIVLSDRSVSRRHARIDPTTRGFVLEDLGSANGTSINDRMIDSPTVIADGDRLGFGDVVLVAELKTPSPPVAAGANLTADYDPRHLMSAQPIEVVVADPERTVADPPVAVVGPSRRGRETAVQVTSPTRAVATPTPAAPGPTPVESRPSLERQRLAQPPEAAAPAAPRRVPELLRSADELASALHRLEHDLSTALQAFEQQGGRDAVLAIIAQARRVEASPRSQADLEGLLGWLPTVRRMLETELTLVSLLAPRSSDALD
jgi:predicted component of type VI protein secretion system